MQTFITLLIVSLAVGYVGRRVYRAFQPTANPCAGCSGCSLKEEIRRKKHEKEDCWHKN